MKVKAMLSWISEIVTTVLIILLLIIVLIVVASKSAGEEPSLFGYQLKTVLSGSMEPEMQTGSIILIQKNKNTAEFKKGDVITFQTKDNLLITHRIIEVQNDGQRYITQGDNNNGPDVEPVLAHNIVGKYSGYTVPYVGYVIHFLNTGQGAILFLIIPGIFFLGYAVFTIWSALRHIEAPKEVN